VRAVILSLANGQLRILYLIIGNFAKFFEIISILSPSRRAFSTHFVRNISANILKFCFQAKTRFNRHAVRNNPNKNQLGAKKISMTSKKGH
jgi:hypothetical protein